LVVLLRQEGERDGLPLPPNTDHDALDRAVAAAYGWPEDISTEEALARLLALNLERAHKLAQSRVRGGRFSAESGQ
jgi:hypothetical protein